MDNNYCERCRCLIPKSQKLCRKCEEREEEWKRKHGTPIP